MGPPPGPCSYWPLLSTEIVLRILALLPASRRAALRQVCRQWRRVARSHLPVRLRVSGGGLGDANEEAMLRWASSCTELRRWVLHSTTKPLPDTAVDALTHCVSRSRGLG